MNEQQSDNIEIRPPKISKNPVIRWALIIFGSISLFLGIIGIVLPLLPTTPFLLLTAFCYFHSSENFYRWLVEHETLGKYIVYYLEGKGIPMKAKIYSLIAMWFTISLSIFYFVPNLWGKGILFLIAICVSIYIVTRPTLELSTAQTSEG